MKRWVAAAERLFGAAVLGALALGALVLAANHALWPGLALLLLMAALVILRYARRCPACGDRRFPRHPDHGVYECDACGERFRRVRQGAATWLKREAVVPDLEPTVLRRLRRSEWVVVPQAPGDRWSWISRFLPRLRALRRELRPRADLPLRLLNLGKDPVGDDLGLSTDWDASTTQRPIDVLTPEPVTLRKLVVEGVLVLVIGAACCAIVAYLTRLRVLDEAYSIIIACSIVTCEFIALAITRMLGLKPTATLGLLAADLVLKALHVRAIGRLPDVYVLGSMAFIFPATPLLTAALLRRCRLVEPPAGEFTTGQLLRNKQVRALGRAAKRARQAG